MEAHPEPRPLSLRQSSRVPGGFDSDEESASPTKTVYDDAVSHYDGAGHSRNPSLHSGKLAALNGHAAESSNNCSMVPSSDGAGDGEHSSSLLDEKEIGRKLMDIESSFLPDANESFPSPQLANLTEGSEDTTAGPQTASQPDSSSSQNASGAQEDTTTKFAPPSELRAMNTSALETMSSSPSYAAAKNRAVSRVTSLATIGGYETANEGGGVAGDDAEEAGQITPTRASSAQGEVPDASPTPTKPYTRKLDISGSQGDDAEDESEDRSTLRKRPRYLKGRVTSQRSSYSSRTSASLDDEGNASFGTEYALQSGGGLPLDSATRRDRGLLRTISLGSVASGVSKESENEARARPATAKGPLPALEENGADSGVQTPRGPGPRLDTPTDTVINQRVRNLEVPDTVARKFQQAGGDSENSEPGGNIDATPAAAGRVKNNLTLKEQSSVIDKLQKENWKLKLKLYFMDQMLSERSDEAVSAMVKENIDLKTHKFASQKEVRQLKRTMRELEAKLRERDERLAAQAATMRNSLRSPLQSRGRADTAGEVEFLRERVETYQVEVERLRSDIAVKEGEKRRMAEMLKSSSKRSNVASDYDPQEEVTMWKDLLETETARREQFEEENRRLMAEVTRLESESTSMKHQPNGTSKADTATAVTDGESQSTKTLVEQLRLENAELKRDLGAQTSMLTSRNREKERLYQEIEDLKMGARRRSAADGSRSGAAGTDSILERSASRARRRRPGSRGSGGSGPRAAKVDDAERDAYEEANGRLRDQLATLKMDNQTVSKRLNEVLDELEVLENERQDYHQLQAEHDRLAEQGDEEILAMQTDRDDALQQLQEADQQFEDLQAEAQGRINELEADADQGAEMVQQLEQNLAQREHELEALRGEMRKTSDILDKVETDVQAKLRRIKDLEMEKEDNNREMETLEAALLEANSKADKQGFELQSRQSECAFLREEQDGFAIKIGDLETALRAAQASAAAERDKAKDLGERLKEERHQREVIGSKEKQDVQRMMNDLNRDATAAKDESRRLKKSVETREAEVKQLKERLKELESGLREVLGDTGGSKSSFVHAIVRLQKELEHTAEELGISRQSLAEKTHLLSKRDALLESHGLESRKLSDMLEKERSARRTERAQYEQWEKTHHHNARTLSQKETRISELEGGRSSDKRKLAALEAQFKEQLQERNSLLLQLWTKLSVLCGSDWQHQNSLIGGHYPTVEVVASKLPQFSQTLLLAVRTIETTVGGFRARVRAVEHDLAKEYQQLEHNLDLRIKRLDRLESAVQVSRVAGAVGAAPEIAKLRGENRLLRADLAALQKQEQIRAARENAVSIEPGPPAPLHRHASATAGGGGTASPSSEVATGPGGRARAAAALARHHSTTTAEALQRHDSLGGGGGGGGGGSGGSGSASPLRSPALEPSQHRWLYRLRNMEKQLITEREGRLLDRSGARKRLEAEQQEKEELQAALEREKQRHQTD